MNRELVIESLTRAYRAEISTAFRHRMFGEVTEARKAIDTSNGILKAGEALGIEAIEIKLNYKNQVKSHLG